MQIETELVTVQELIGGASSWDQMAAEFDVMEAVDQTVISTESSMSESISTMMKEEANEMVEGTSQVIQILTTQEREMQDTKARHELEVMRTQMEELRQTVLDEKEKRQRNSVHIKSLLNKFRGLERDTVTVMQRLVKEQSSSILKEVTTKIMERIERTRSISTFAEKENKEEIKVMKNRNRVLEKQVMLIKSTVDEGLRKEVTMNSEKTASMKWKIESLEKKIAGMDTNNEDEAARKAVTDLRSTVEMLKKSLVQAQSERSANTEDIGGLHDMLNEVVHMLSEQKKEVADNKAEFDAVSKTLNTRLTKVMERTQSIDQRLDTQMKHFERQMIKMQSRLVNAETKIVQVAQDVNNMQTEMTEMKKMMLLLKEKQSEEPKMQTVMKEVETKISSTMEKFVSHYVEKTQESATTMINTMSESMTVLREKIEKEKIFRKRAESVIINLQKDLEHLKEEKTQTTETMQREMEETRRLIERETTRRKQAQLQIEMSSKLVGQLKSTVAKQSSRVTALVSETKEIFSHVEQHQARIENLERKSSLTLKTMSTFQESISHIEKQVLMQKEKDANTEKQLTELSEVIRVVDKRSQNNHQKILEILQEHKVTVQEFELQFEKLAGRISDLEKHLRSKESTFDEDVKEVIREEIKEVRGRCMQAKVVLSGAKFAEDSSSAFSEALALCQASDVLKPLVTGRTLEERITCPCCQQSSSASSEWSSMSSQTVSSVSSLKSDFAMDW